MVGGWWGGRRSLGYDRMQLTLGGLGEGGGLAAAVSPGGGSSAALLGGGRSTALLGGGCSPTLLGGGCSPALLGGGCSPALLGGGCLAALLGGGCLAALLEGGGLAALLEGGCLAALLGGVFFRVLLGGGRLVALPGGERATAGGLAGDLRYANSFIFSDNFVKIKSHAEAGWTFQIFPKTPAPNPRATLMDTLSVETGQQLYIYRKCCEVAKDPGGFLLFFRGLQLVYLILQTIKIGDQSQLTKTQDASSPHTTPVGLSRNAPATPQPSQFSHQDLTGSPLRQPGWGSGV